LTNYSPFIKLLERLNRNISKIWLAGCDDPILLINDEDLET